MERGVYFYHWGSLSFPMFFESECEYFTFSLRRAGNQLGGLHWSIHIYQRQYLDRYFFVLLNRDTQTPNEKTNWFWHLWPYCNLEVGLADLRSSKHKRHPNTKYLHRRLKKPMHQRWVTLQIMAKMYLLPFLCVARESSGIGSYFYSYIVTFPYCFFFSGIHVQRFQCWHLTFTHAIWTTQRCLFHRLRILD